MSIKEKEQFGPQLRSTLDHSSIRKLYFFGSFRTREILRYYYIEKRVDATKSEFLHKSRFCGPCVGSDENNNFVYITK